MQIKHIENICCRLNDIIAEAKSCVNNKCRIYQCTSIAAGIIIVILYYNTDWRLVMEVSIIFKIAAVGILVSVLSQVLKL